MAARSSSSAHFLSFQPALESCVHGTRATNQRRADHPLSLSLFLFLFFFPLFCQSLPTDLGGSTYRSRVLYVPQRPALLAGTPLDFLRTVEGFKANRTYTPLPVAPSAAPTASAFNDVESTQPHGWRIQSLEEAFPEMDMRNSGTSTPRTANANANANASKPSGTSTPTSRSVESSASPAPEQFTTLGLGFPSSSPIPPDAIFLASAYFNLSPAVWERDWIQISGGEAQRASLAVALSLVSRRRAEGVLLLDGK